MATDTGTDDFVMIYGAVGDRCPGRRELGMAGFAHIAGINMRSILATGRCTVVAGDAIIYKGTVIHRSNRYPCRDAVAAIAFQRGRYMSAALSSGNNVVMTAGTNTNDLTVIGRAGW